jgi:O-antigen/teichoic acid export membrane protein
MLAIPSLRRRTIGALVWNLSGNAGHQLFALLVAIVLARLLEPEHFGLIGMLVLFIGVGNFLVDAGFTAALVQKREIDRELSTIVLAVNLTTGVVLASAMAIGAPYLSAFFEEPDLAPLATILSIGFVINALGCVQTAHLTRQLNFRALTSASMIAILISGTGAIVLAAMGFGVWSLAAQQLSNVLIRVTLLWCFNRWRPQVSIRWARINELLGFSLRMVLSGLLHQVSSNLYYLVIGRTYSTADVGYYSRALLLQQMPSQGLGTTVGQVTFPVFSSLHDERDRLYSVARRSFGMLAMINTPVMLGLAIVAPEVVRIVLGERWDPVAPLLQILCFVGLLAPLGLNNLSMLMGLGRSDLFLRQDIVKAILVVVNIAVTFRLGLAWMMAGHVLVTAVVYCVNARAVGKLIGFGLRAQVSDVAPYLAAAVVMLAVVVPMGAAVVDGPALKLAVQVTVGAGVYVGACAILRPAAFREAWSTVGNAIGNRFQAP